MLLVSLENTQTHSQQKPPNSLVGAAAGIWCQVGTRKSPVFGVPCFETNHESRGPPVCDLAAGGAGLREP